MISEEVNALFVQTKRHAKAIDKCSELTRWAMLYDWGRRLRGEAMDLVHLDNVVGSMHSCPKVARGLRIVGLANIVGSVSQRKDFTCDFLPRYCVNRQRWARIDLAFAAGEPLPLVELYQVGTVYFVMDGHHRISVACARGFKEIEANVTEILGSIPPANASKRNHLRLTPTKLKIRRRWLGNLGMEWWPTQRI